jgi:hypothetical protein
MADKYFHNYLVYERYKKCFEKEIRIMLRDSATIYFQAIPLCLLKVKNFKVGLIDRPPVKRLVYYIKFVKQLPGLINGRMDNR